MREIVFDTETTGLNPSQGDRIVEVGCVELVNHVPTGKTYQCYINPERSLSDDVVSIHGLTEEFLSDKPKFYEIADEFLSFIGEDSKLIAHNASFDIKFINAELVRCKRKPLSDARVIDTLQIARQKFPGSHVSVDDLCKRFHIDNSVRTKHGALVDAKLLVEIYLELIGCRGLGFLTENHSEKILNNNIVSAPGLNFKDLPKNEPRSFPPSEEELKQHYDFVVKIKNNLWGYL